MNDNTKRKHSSTSTEPSPSVSHLNKKQNISVMNSSLSDSSYVGDNVGDNSFHLPQPNLDIVGHQQGQSNLHASAPVFNPAPAPGISAQAYTPGIPRIYQGMSQPIRMEGPPQTPLLPESDIQRIALAVKGMIAGELKELIATRVAPLVECVNRLAYENKMLNLKVDELEMYSRRSCVRIFGVSEDKSDTDEAVMEIAEKLEVPLDRTELVVSHRVGKSMPSKPRAIIARITNYNIRHRLIKDSKKLSKIKGMEGVSVNQELTKIRAKIAAEARKMVKSELLKSSFVWDGKIFAIDFDGKKHLLRCYDDLVKLNEHITGAKSTVD